MTQPRPSSGFSPYHKRLFVFLSVATFFECELEETARL